MILDGMYGGKNTSATMAAQAKQIEAPPQPEAATIKEEEKPETTQELTPEEEEQKMENYKQLYLKEKAKKEQKEQQPLLDEINANAYRGDGSKQSRRMYLLAGIQGITSFSIVNVRPPPMSDDENEDELASILDLIDDSEEEEEEEEKQPEENQDLMMLADTNRIKRRTQRRSRKNIEPDEREEGE